MPPRPLLAALFVGVACAAGPALAQNSPPLADDGFSIRQQTQALSRTAKQIPSGADLAAAAGYASERAAAVAFVELARKNPDQRMEYCAYIVRGPDKRFSLGPTMPGDMNHCPLDSTVPAPAGAVAVAHTHPLWGRPDDVSAAGQVFSEGDYQFAEILHMPIYLGGPAGHILRYAPGGTFCRGQSFVRRNFEVVRDLAPTVVGRLPVNPGVDAPLYSEAGVKLPKPAYCQSL
jgi:hypothetical protein